MIYKVASLPFRERACKSADNIGIAPNGLQCTTLTRGIAPLSKGRAAPFSLEWPLVAGLGLKFTLSQKGNTK